MRNAMTGRVVTVAGIIGAVAMMAWAVGPSGARAQGRRSPAVERGEYLVHVGGCHDCHTPAKAGPNGPEPDMTRMLSGHPADLAVPAAPAVTAPWMGSVTATFTAWAGPWGTSYTRNLTPDKATGLGEWTEQQFIETLRNGRRQGRGRQLLPPMPWPNYAKMTDADLKAVFAYLRTIPAVRNQVPEPVIPQPPGQ